MGPDARRAQRFVYTGFDVDPRAGRVTCRYRLDGLPGLDGPLDVREVVGFPRDSWPDLDWDRPGVSAAARLVYLLAGVSYYKAGAPPVVDLGSTAVTATELEFLRHFYLDGLGEFAYRNGLDLSGLRFVASTGPPPETEARTVAEPGGVGRPLVPFGGGIDSIVSVELLRERADDVALFVVNRPGDRFAAIEAPARVTGLPVLRAERSIDPTILRSGELGLLNGHVPVTGVISAIAVLAAVLAGRDAVVLSNEWSASSATLEVDGRPINHQWSKGEAFESGFREVLAESLGGGPEYFSLLRSTSELWIAARFAEQPQYLDHFRSCNRAFAIDPARRLERWCGVCDKCCFVDLVLAPFVGAARLARVFEPGAEPLANPRLTGTFERLLGLTPDAKPWECVGDVAESRVALRLAAARPDRRGDPVPSALAAAVTGFADPEPAVLMQPIGRNFVPARYAPDLLTA